YRQKVKSPVEYAVGMVRMIGVGVTGRITVNPYSLLGVLELMGQQLYAPPNVKGWEAGKAWLNTATVLARHNFAHSLVNGMGDLNSHAKKYNLQTFFPAVNPLAFVLHEGITEPGKIVDLYADLLLPGDFRPEVRSKLVAHIGDTSPDTEAFAQRCRDALFVLLPQPEYQSNCSDSTYRSCFPYTPYRGGPTLASPPRLSQALLPHRHRPAHPRLHRAHCAGRRAGEGHDPRCPRNDWRK